MITNPPPKSQTLKMLGIVCSVIGTCFKLKSGSIVGGGWGEGGVGVMKVCSFRCLFLFCLGCVRLRVSPRARCSHYGCSDLLLMAAICCVHRGYQVHGNRSE